MKHNFLCLFFVLFLGVILISCAVENSETVTETPLPTITNTLHITETTTVTPKPSNTSPPTITLTLLVEKTPGTRLNFIFPFEPGFPGYIVQFKSNTLTVDLLCILNQDNNNGRGEAVESSSNSNEWNVLGTCDTSSMTLYEIINEKITVTVILGGFPVVYDVTKLPDRITDQTVEYDFEYSFDLSN